MDIESLYSKLGSHRKLAKELGIATSTAQEWLKKARLQGASQDRMIGTGASIPHLPPDNIPINERIDILCRKFEVKKRAYDLNTWFPITIHDPLPIGLVFFGDPHVDNPGANWPLLREHARLASSTPGVYGVNIGDTSDNWAGSLARLYASSHVTAKEARELAEWFMHDSGIQWLVWLIGNHDGWGDGAAILDLLAKKYGTKKVVCHDWEARFKLVFPGGREYRINAAHDFRGNSMWNPIHGPLKAALLGADTDIHACGHLHNYAYMTLENANRGKISHVLRVRGYKFMDEYARRMGVVEQEQGASAMFVFDPLASEEPARLLFFPGVEAGCNYLSMIRKKRSASQGGTVKARS